MMGLEGVAASTVTYNCVIDACAHGGNPGKAAEIFAEMKERKVRGKNNMVANTTWLQTQQHDNKQKSRGDLWKARTHTHRVGH